MVLPHERLRAAAWASLAGRRVKVLADGGFQVSAMFGVAFQLRIHGDTSNTPATFVIDADGVLRWSHVGTGPRSFADRPSVAAVASAIAAARHKRSPPAK